MGDRDVGYLAGQMDTIKDLLLTHVEESKTERARLRDDMDELKEELGDLKSEITKYKFLARGLGATILCILTLKFGDIIQIWKGGS